MKSRNVAALGWASLMTILAGLWVVFGEHPGLSYGGRGELFFDTLLPRLDEVGIISLQRGRGELILYRDGDQWVLSSHGNYPADQEKVDTLFKAFRTATSREPITKFQMRSDSHGLESEDTLHMFLANQAGEGIGGYYAIGHRVEGAEGRSLTYISADLYSRAWLVTDLPALSSNVAEWMDSALLTIEPGEVTALSLDGQALDIGGSNQAAGRALNALVQLQAVDVVKLDSLLEPVTAPVRRFQLETAGGKSITVALYERGAEIWASVEGASEPIEPKAVTASVEPEAGLADALGDDAAAETGDALSAGARGLADKREGRLFKLSQQVASTLTAPLDSE